MTTHRPQTADVLINTLKQNDIRNESGHAYLQELDGEVESLSSELSKLDKEEKQLIALEPGPSPAAGCGAYVRDAGAAGCRRRAFFFDACGGLRGCAPRSTAGGLMICGS